MTRKFKPRKVGFIAYFKPKSNKLTQRQQKLVEGYMKTKAAIERKATV